MTTVVVTGATGFLGRHVTTCLANIGADVIPISRRPVSGMRQVQDYSQSPTGDLVIHLAEEPDRGVVNRLGEAAVRDSAAVVTALVHRFGARIVYASSATVYGDEHILPCTVDMPVVATDPYSRLKLFNERIVLEAGGTVVRLSNLFGAGMTANTVMSDILHQIPGSGPLRVRDDTPVRDFLSVVDAASALCCLVETSFAGILNVGSGMGTSVRRLAELALASVGQEDRGVVAIAPTTRRSINVLDISETTRHVGWWPRASLRERLAQLLHHTTSL